MWELNGLTTQLLHVVPLTDLLAYVGPGLGAGVIAVVVGLFASVALALFTILWYPIKRFFRAVTRKTETSTESYDQS